MIKYRIVERQAFDVIGKKTWISGQDNSLFGRFWEQCRAEDLFKVFHQISGLRAGAQTEGGVLGVSCVEQDPSNRVFYYMIGIEIPEGGEDIPADLECHHVSACQWAVFECRGKMPEALVVSEMYAFMEWLPASGYAHAYAPEMEVYPPQGSDKGDDYCEFWLPIAPKP